MVIAMADYRSVSAKAERVDPLHWCDRDLRGGIDELTFIVNEAATARDVAGVLHAHKIAVELRQCLERVELLALHFAEHLTEPRR